MSVRHLLVIAVLAVMIILSTVGLASAGTTTTRNETCRLDRVVKENRSFVFHSLLIRLRMQVAWCYDGTKVTSSEVTCEIEKFDRVTITVESCQAQQSSIAWKGRPKGGFYAQASVNYSNCVLKFGCWQGAVLNVERWLYADGAVTTTPRQGAKNV